jgi:hypothetical protein
VVEWYEEECRRRKEDGRYVKWMKEDFRSLPDVLFPVWGVPEFRTAVSEFG